MIIWGAPTRDTEHTALLSDEERFVTCGGLVELFDPPGRSGPVWIQLAKAGAYRGHAAGPFELNATVFSDIVRNFNAQANRRIPIDFEHASELDAASGSIPTEGAPAQGWIVDLDNRGDSLWGLVEWLEPARTYIREKKYRWFSPAIRFNSRDRVTGARIGARMSSGALTNNPFLDGMAPMAAKDIAANPAPAATAESGGAAESKHMFDTKKKPESQVLEVEGQVLKAEGSVSLKDFEEKVTALAASELEVSRLTITLSDREAALEKANEELKALKEEKAARIEADLKARVDEAFDTYVDAKKLTEDKRDHMLRMLKGDADWFEKEFPKVAVKDRHLLRDLSETREAPATVVEGTQDVAISLRDLTNQLMKANPKLSYEDASIQADKILNPKKAKR